ncbi:MAG TPA: hypothetical protein DD473_11720 [Planctomycetaceae bacterium]|nr:hypothetical protein [Planctomycetaceae bacterium]
MRFIASRAIQLSLACAWGLGLAACLSHAADQPAKSLKPIPEPTAIPEHSDHSEDGQVIEHCPYCEQGAMGVDGHCPHCRGGRGNRGVHAGHGHNGVYGGRNGVGRQYPGANWCAPSKVTLQRERIQYQKWYPNYWSGYGPGPAPAPPYYPMVYTPTDTAQMGYYYQHAPSWTAQPWRTPGPAHPGVWHNRYCGRCQGYPGAAYPSGYVNGGYGYGQDQIIEVTPADPNGEQEEEMEAPVIEQDPNAMNFPGPSFTPRTPVISVLPDAPPEV